jgi:branched-chain amino acid transport system permease protein
MNLATSYVGQEKWLGASRHLVPIGLAAAAFVAFPWLAGNYWVYFACLLGINVIAATGLNITMGYVGLLSLGHAAFVGIGAYTSAILTAKFGISTLLTIPAAGFAAAVVGIAFGLPSLRIHGLYLAVATLTAQFLLQFVFVHWESLTGGDVGMAVAPAKIAGITLATDRELFYVIAVLATGMVLFAANLMRSRIGRAFVAVRERGRAAEVLGVNVVRYKLLGFSVGAFYAGVAGALLAHFHKFVSPEHFTLHLSVFFLAAVIIGGMGSTTGAVLGALFMTLVPEIVSASVETIGAKAGIEITGALNAITEVIFGFFIVLFLICEPQGLARIWSRAIGAVKTWPLGK